MTPQDIQKRIQILATEIKTFDDRLKKNKQLFQKLKSQNFSDGLKLTKMHEDFIDAAIKWGRE